MADPPFGIELQFDGLQAYSFFAIIWAISKDGEVRADMTEREFCTERLVLRPFVTSDLAAYTDIMTQSAVTQYLGSGKDLTAEDVEKALGRVMSGWEDRGYGVWAVVLKDNMELIGHCGFLPVEKLGEIELLYAFDTAAWGKGYASEAAVGCLGYAKTAYDWQQVVAMAYPDNRASCHVLTKLGFTFAEEIEAFGSKLNLYRYTLKASI